MAEKHGRPLLPENACPGVVAALHRRPEYFDVFGIGASIAMSVTWAT